MTPHPYVNVWTTDPSGKYPIIKPATLRREFLDKTAKGHGYHCQPMSNANLHGWEFILPHDVEVIWDGVSDVSAEHVKVLKGGFLENGLIVADTKTANATITFHINAMIETDKDHYILLNGPANHFVSGAKPMSALVRSDWYSYNPLQYCWQITAPNKIITFKKGTPFLTLINYPIGLLESTELVIQPMTIEQSNKIGEYNRTRNAYYSDNAGKFPLMYKKGLDNTGTKHLDEVYKPKPSNPKMIEYINE